VSDDLDPVWRALASPMRRAMLDVLRRGPRTTGELAERFPDVSRFAVMQHLGVLEEAQLVVAVRDGRERWNHLNVVPIRRIYERWVSRYDDVVAADLTSLKAVAEGAGPPSRRGRRTTVRPVAVEERT
jgi:DNA-binding transcriptional ArsR family regulator